MSESERRRANARRLTRAWRSAVAAAAIAAIAGCAAVDGSRTADDDPMRVRGSATVGPVVGSPGGPYSPRP